ncbi:protein PALS1 [Lepeophtheirus salmonis]|nr:MAGUK p55 subfamily member 5-like [Lepeophtheirus salmonis]
MSNLGVQFANIMVEFERDTREMPVDVPDSFVAVSKTPPKYPPPPERRVSANSSLTSSSHSHSSSLLPTPQQSMRIQKYSEDLKKRNKKNEDLFRQSLRNSIQIRENGVVNQAFRLNEAPSPLMTLSSMTEALQRLEKYDTTKDTLAAFSHLFQNKEFKASISIHQAVSNAEGMSPASLELCSIAEECLNTLKIDKNDPETEDLIELLSNLSHLFEVHDKIARQNTFLKSLISEEDALLSRLSHYAEPNIKIVKIEKTNEPLGATVKNEDEAVVIGRIIRGGVAERSGLLREGDEILEVNEVELRGKNVNEVCDILANMHGTLTLLVVPSRVLGTNSASSKPNSVMHIKSYIDYDPEDDPYVPCRELGISFQKGDILHVINQCDPHWWQAFRDGEDDQTLPGLIPSASFQEQREAMKQTIIAQDSEKYVHGTRSTGGFLCAKKSGRKKRRKVPYLSEDEVDSDHILTYEEVALYYPRADRKRPVVLVGPPNIGRHELRKKLMQDSSRFAAARPHTSRPRGPDEEDSKEFHFISRLQFEKDILARKFVEHGEYDKSYYGTSFEAIRSVISSGKICVLNLHPQCLKILKSSDFMPYVVFVAPPSLEKLKRWKMENSDNPASDEDLKETIERAREMEDVYGHFFDMIIIYSDPVKAYQQLLNEINLLEREPQWVPLDWQKYF